MICLRCNVEIISDVPNEAKIPFYYYPQCQGQMCKQLIWSKSSGVGAPKQASFSSGECPWDSWRGQSSTGLDPTLHGAAQRQRLWRTPGQWIPKDAWGQEQAGLLEPCILQASRPRPLSTLLKALQKSNTWP